MPSSAQPRATPAASLPSTPTASSAPSAPAGPALIGSAALALWRLHHPDWMAAPQRGGIITRRFLFKDFKQAFAFMTQVAMYAEQHNHHPEWSNVYNRVDVTLTTHDAGGITQLDLDLASYADEAHHRVVHH